MRVTLFFNKINNFLANSVRSYDRSPRKKRYKFDNFLPYIFIFPALLIVMFVIVYPIFISIISAFYNNEGSFIGWGNYVNLFNDKFFFSSLKITAIYILLYIGGIFFVGFFTAFVINSGIKGQKFFSALITSPYAIPDVVASLVWMWIFDYQFGILNYLLKIVHVIHTPVNWLANPSIALYSVLLGTIWRLFPLHCLIISAGIKSVPQELIEAAKIDGAKSLQRFFYIILPFTRRILSILLLLTIVWSFKRFTILWLLTGGGPARSSETVVIRIYLAAFRTFNMNYAYTMGNVLLVILTCIILVYFIFTREKEAI